MTIVNLLELFPNKVLMLFYPRIACPHEGGVLALTKVGAGIHLLYPERIPAYVGMTIHN